MDKDVIISIQGLQTYDGDSDDIELVTEGTLSETESGYRLSYEETELTGLEGTTTMFQVEPEKISLIRVGTVSSEMVFEMNRRHMSLYATPYGNLEIGITARKMQSSLSLTGGKIEIDYDIEINHAMMGQSLFRIDVREPSPLKS